MSRSATPGLSVESVGDAEEELSCQGQRKSGREGVRQKRARQSNMSQLGIDKGSSTLCQLKPGTVSDKC